MMASVPKARGAAATSAAHAHHTFLPHWLTHLGPLGLFAVAVLDSSVIPLPLPGSTDLLLLWLVSHHGNPYLLVASATTGSVLGGYTNWASGKRGGEATLERYKKSSSFKRVSGWMEQHSILSVFVPAILPPPVPLTMFLMAAGALGVSLKRFLLAFTVGRTLRYTLVALLAVTYGRRIVRIWSGTLDKWSGPLLTAFFAMFIAMLAFGIWQFRRSSNTPELATSFVSNNTTA